MNKFIKNQSTVSDNILEVKDLSVKFKLEEGTLEAVNNMSFNLKRGTTLGIVGESGSGKSVTTQAILKLIEPPGVVSGEVKYHTGDKKIIDILELNKYSKKLREIRGGEISMIFQEPMKAFSPMYTIGNQIMESVLLHVTKDKKEARIITEDMLVRVGMSNPSQRFEEYPHQLSGGLRQRAMIAMALVSNPDILIADEPTTALDVTIQAQVLDLIVELKNSTTTAVIFITHDLAVISEVADEVAVMYLGEIVEKTDVKTLFSDPIHPYTKGLLKAIPSINNLGARLESIKGTVPTPMNLSQGCNFYNRCPLAKDGLCNVKNIAFEEVYDNHFVRCTRIGEGISDDKR